MSSLVCTAEQPQLLESGAQQSRLSLGSQQLARSSGAQHESEVV
jgi:hypothetical protein